MKLLIVADDSDVNNPRKGTAIIKITVKDDNNHDPNINLNCLKSCVNNTSMFGLFQTKKEKSSKAYIFYFRVFKGKNYSWFSFKYI